MSIGERHLGLTRSSSSPSHPIRYLPPAAARPVPIVQYGWAARDIANVLVDGVDVIHMRYGVAETQTDTADLARTVRNVTFRNIRASGVGGNLMRIVPLANHEDVRLENISLDAFSVRSTGIYESQFPLWMGGDGTPVAVSGFVIEGFSVGGVRIDAENYADAGGLSIAEECLADGRVVII
ncbi:glycosyl hydrolase family 49-domain-containing protein [Xylaria bambusicola]|uniref:glycosyl hydrolase family 49-domain-containing protein n=1 Tax=Xylaria bambusicola TaxID=326684 RepID=UPI002007F974|nr:glycosyl hydrolase family 49-domain-containing protein [Xylaria bambusicola]KAI0502916.1 glycosyl hydrolase family 49-domain-containing protein [Xylaria bambusicola]